MPQNIFTSSFLARTTNLVRKNNAKVVESLIDANSKFEAGDIIDAAEYPDCSTIKLNLKNEAKDFQFKNAVSLYEAMPMTPYLASDPRLWTYLSLVVFREYMNSLRPLSRETRNLSQYVLTHYFCVSSSVKDLLLNDISLLWWITHLTVSEESVDKYHLTREVFTMLDYTRHLLPGVQGRSKQFRHAVLEVVVEKRDLFKTHKEAKIRLIMRRLNTRAGFQLFPVFSKENIKELIMQLSPEIEICTS